MDLTISEFLIQSLIEVNAKYVDLYDMVVHIYFIYDVVTNSKEDAFKTSDFFFDFFFLSLSLMYQKINHFQSLKPLLSTSDQNQVCVSQQLNRKCVLFDYICSRHQCMTHQSCIGVYSTSVWNEESKFTVRKWQNSIIQHHNEHSVTSANPSIESSCLLWDHLMVFPCEWVLGFLY